LALTRAWGDTATKIRLFTGQIRPKLRLLQNIAGGGTRQRAVWTVFLHPPITGKVD
jgi:hypothetical protein